MKQPIGWTTVAIIIGLPVLLAFMAWLIHILAAPAYWCGVPVGAAKVTGQRLPIADCTSIVLELIKWLGWYGVALLGTLALAFIVIVVRDLKASVDAHGPAGLGLRVGGDPDPPAPPPPPTTTVNVNTPPPPPAA